MDISNLELTYELKKVERFFNGVNELLYDLGITNDAEVFKLLNAYQNTRLENIQKASNEKQRVALMRTVDYYDTDIYTKWKKSKQSTKEKLLFKFINNFVLQIPSIKYIDSTTYSKYCFNEICLFKDKILSNKSWYLRIIPESRWLIEYLENN